MRYLRNTSLAEEPKADAVKEEDNNKLVPRSTAASIAVYEAIDLKHSSHAAPTIKSTDYKIKIEGNHYAPLKQVQFTKRIILRIIFSALLLTLAVLISLIIF